MVLCDWRMMRAGNMVAISLSIKVGYDLGEVDVRRISM